MTIFSNYSFQLVKDARTVASITVSAVTASILLITLVALTRLGYLPTYTYPIGAAGFTAILLIGIVIATLRRKNEPSIQEPREVDSPITTSNINPDSSIVTGPGEGKIVPYKEISKESDNDTKRSISNERMGAVCPAAQTYSVAEKIVLTDQEVYFLGIFTGGSPRQQQEIQSLTKKMQTKLQQELGTCDMSSATQVDEVLKKIFNPEDLKTSEGVCASIALVTDNKIYNLSIGAGIPHIALVTWRNPYQPNNGCYEVSCKDVGRKRITYYLETFGRLDACFPDEEIVEITEETDKPRIHHLTKGESNGGGTFFLWASGYQEGDYLILGCSAFWKSHGLKVCYERIKEMDKKGMNPQEMAASLATGQETVVVFKILGT